MRPPPDPAPLIAQLAASRLRLRQALVDAAAPPGASAARDQTFESFPGVGLLAAMLRDWWRQHPLQIGGRLGIELAQRLLKPAVGRHPALWVLGSALAGALLWRTRPWRWLFRSLLLYGLLPGRSRRAQGSPWPIAMLMTTWLMKQLPTKAAPAQAAGPVQAPARPAPPAPGPRPGI